MPNKFTGPSTTVSQLTVNGKVELDTEQATVEVIADNGGIVLKGNKDAGDTGADVTIDTTATRASGDVFVVKNNGTEVFAVSYNGGISGAVPESRTITAGAGLTGGGDLSANRTLSVDPAATLVAAGYQLGAAGPTVSQSGGTVTIAATGASTSPSVVTDSVNASPAKIHSFRRGGGEQAYVSTTGDYVGTQSALGIINNGGGVYAKGSLAAASGGWPFRVGNLNGLNATDEMFALFSDNFSTKKFAVEATGKLSFTGAAAAKVAGQATLVGGTVTIATTAALTGNLIFIQLFTPGGTLGTHYSYTISTGVSFTINAVNTSGALVNTDTSVVNWWIVKAA